MSPVTWFARLLFRGIFRGIFRTTIHGRERLPRTGGVLLVANHLSWADPPFIGSLLDRPVDFMAMVELFRNPVLRWLAHQLGAFPIDRKRPDPRAAREAVRRLHHGRCVAIFPEGGIRLGPQSVLGGDPQFKPGAGAIALLGKVPIVPIILRDTRNPYALRNWLRRASMSLTIGRPFCLWISPACPPGERRQQARAMIREQLLLTAQADR